MLGFWPPPRAATRPRSAPASLGSNGRLGQKGDTEGRLAHAAIRRRNQGSRQVWPTGAGFGQDHIFILDAYSRRVVRVDQVWAAEASCEIK